MNRFQLKIKFLLLAVFLLANTRFISQNSKKDAIEAARKLQDFYNAKKYSEMYALMSAVFKKNVDEKTFTETQKNIFVFYTNLQEQEYLREENKIHAFTSHYSGGDLNVQLRLDSVGKIDYLRFQPMLPKTKITDYATDNKNQNSLDSLVNEITKDYMQSPQNCGLSIGIIKDEKISFYNYGESSRGSKKLPTMHTIYEIGSMSKSFCGILLARAIIEGKVKADDDIRKYLPKKEYKNLEVEGKPITLVHLANHSSGLPRIPEDLEAQSPYDPLNPYKNYNKEMLYNYLQKVMLKSPPGRVCEYSNIGMGLLGIILENVYGKSFETLVKEKICQPLNMPNTGMKLSAEQEKLFAKGYNPVGNETPPWDLGDLCAAGGLRSDMADMMNFMKANLEEKDEALKLSHQATFTDGSTVGMAWMQMKRYGNNMIWHNGSTFGFRSFSAFVKEKNCAVVVLSNSASDVDPIALRILKFLQK